MTRQALVRCTLAAWLALAGMTAACSEPSHIGGTRQGTDSHDIVPRLVVSDSGADGVVLTLALDISGGSAKIGSFTARVVYDSTSLTFLEEVPLHDGALRALNPTSGLVRIAGASAQGIDPSSLASLRFRARAATAWSRARLEIDELHEQTRTDLRPRLQRLPALP